METKGRAPVWGYAAALALVIAWLVWQTVRLGGIEREAAALMAAPGADAMLMFEDENPALAKLRKQQAEYAAANWSFKTAFLLFVALPTVVIFPAMLSTYEAPEAPKARVVKAKDLTFDDLDTGFVPEATTQLSSRSRTIVVNGLLFLAGLSIFGIFAAIKPAAFWRSPTGLPSGFLFAICGMLVFAASGIAHPLQERHRSPMVVAALLGAGFLFFGGLAWWRL